jgi:hypothetical protein
MEKHRYDCTENENSIILVADGDKLDELQIGILDRRTGKCVKNTGGLTVIGAHDLGQALASVGLRIIPSNELTGSRDT